MEIHRIPWKCVRFMISVKFQLSSETHLRNINQTYGLIGVLASGPERLDLHRRPWKVQNVCHFSKKHQRHTDFDVFHCDLALFVTGARNYDIPIGLLRFLGCKFQQNHKFHGNRDLLWNSQISMKISGFHQKPRFSRKCWFRRRPRLEYTIKWSRL